jgi:crotonobetainyl-CoA:carnitine CoA-transferase CaiB-like acyl-CoA transferase
MAGPVVGLRVLDLTTGVAGPYMTKLLADHGADVIKVEPPGGDLARQDGPFSRDTPHPEGSGRFLYLNTNKRSIILDLFDERDRTLIRSLAGESDLVVEDQPPGRLGELGLGYADLNSLSPGVVLVSITPWGQTGPYLNYRLTDLIAQAMGGPMLWTGSAEREPLRLGGGALALYQAGAVAALAAMVALFRRLQTGEGDHIDLSIYETQAGSRDRASPYVVSYAYNGAEPRRQLRGTALGSGMRPCRDGYINLNAGGPRLPAFLRMIGRPDLAAEPGLLQRSRTPEFFEEVEATYLSWLMQHTKAEAAAIAQSHRLLSAPVNTISDLLTDPHFRGRSVWETIDHPHTGPVEYPGRLFIMSATPRPLPRPAPLLDEHGETIRAAANAARVNPATSRPVTTTSRLPLAGVRVADVTVVWAGPHVTQLLAEWGAEVIRVEPVTRIQPSTRWAERRSTRAMEEERGRNGIASGGGYPNFEPGDRPWDRNSGFNSHARNKLSMACDVMTAEGREQFLQLVACSDVVVENNVPDTIEKAGITYDDLVRVKPDLIMLRMPAFGLSGPYRGYRAYGTHLEGLIGHHQVRGYPNGTPDEGGEVYTADAAAGVQGALAVLLALYHRQRTGQGQQIELAQAENFLPMLAELILDWTMNRHDPSPWGNRHRSHAPHNVYPCRGEDQWIAIDVGTDAEFDALCRTLDLPDLIDDPRFADTTSRWTNQSELDALLAACTSEHDKFDLTRQLQSAGIAAGPLQSAAERLACPQLQGRGFFEELENEAVGRHLYPGLIWRMTCTPNRLRRAPVTLGQDNAYIYRDLLGMSGEEYERRRTTGTIGTRYVPEAFAA